MKLAHRRHTPGTTDVELVFGVLCVPLAAAASLVLRWIPHAWLPRCMLHATVGVPCPTCGASRGLGLLVRGRILDAWQMQPLIVTLAIAALLYSLYAFIVVLGRFPRLRLVGLSRNQQRMLWGAAVITLLLNWIYLGLSGV